MDLKTRIDIAAGRQPADLVLRNGRVVNVLSCEIHEGDVAIAGEHIVGIGRYEGRETVDLRGQYVCPGLIDGHVHIESSMLSVPEFARLVCTRGTTAVIADPHELANVMGVEGVRYVLSSSKFCPIHVFVMLSSCVPASPYESSGAELTALDLEPLLADRWVIGLAEVMDYPGVISAEPACLDKIAVVGSRPIDGHAPGVRGRDLCAYAAAGIGSDHECTTLEEAREKLRMGLHIMIREGSQARNLDALLPLVTTETLDRFMFVTDDKDVEDLLEEGHIDFMIRRAIAAGLNPVHAVKLATFNPANYFGLRQLGAVAPGRIASLAIVDDLSSFRVRRTYHAGRLVAEDGAALPLPGTHKPPLLRSSINVKWLEPEQFVVAAPSSSADGACRAHVIEVLENRIDTRRSVETLPVQNGRVVTDPQRDICKLAVIERHQAGGGTGLGFVRGFGLKRGALASSIGHDAHNLAVVGVSDADIYTAAVKLVKMRGGLCVVCDGQVLAESPLPIGGLMSEADAPTLRAQLRALHQAAASLGAALRRPFMALSFLTLSVIGELKLTDQGLVDVARFKLIDLIAK
ncbi:Adenine deaminase [Phycisphaerae bacterium RAS1]|nr:Adenine deaminase [Phycisphaerae bacterium RAS1]